MEPPFIVMAGLDPAIQQNEEIFRGADARRLDGRLPPTPRLRRARVGSLGRRSFSEGGKGGHDE